MLYETGALPTQDNQNRASAFFAWLAWMPGVEEEEAAADYALDGTARQMTASWLTVKQERDGWSKPDEHANWVFCHLNGLNEAPIPF
ncbi:hypothetical protein D9623_33850 (plasmid) [Azospirillum brasilense]|uniref:Uncharacterized protein n=2 Tax=root TaxID=1 RepID=A0A4D8R110_AZOBR|nr:MULTISPECIES: hypothetical protein [Azospirillum]MDW7555426.1 hypothetical protein [Azospirillum brasilense]MDW7595166.1 hypothetical protein [Azospirillum brasilense]MDW7630319.1 hypothetical protein [Azospirillum brasilense]MDX5949687.1 hypothetical protein [Azospirillum brasilense]QCO12889.1 hypothetical protein D3868_28180 [Azospirillum brasilense]